MPHDVTMPQLGMAQDAGKLIAWLKAPGEAVAKGDPLFEVETDKATMEVEAQTDGFLTHVSAAEGEDVPVGATIARISETADAGGEPSAPVAPDQASAPEADALPEGKAVTMPQLGMAQDTGLLVSWQKAPGDVVAADDVLFEVETDKSTMEVPAGIDGFLAATLAEAGEDVPTGDPVAIISAEKPNAPVARSVKSGGASRPDPTQSGAPKPIADAPTAEAQPATPIVARSGKVLASPKLRRAAMLEGLDLNRLAEAGYAQPYHMRDLETLRGLGSDASPETGATMPAQAITIVAEVAESGFEDFARWAAETHGLTDADAILSALAAIRETEQTISVSRYGIVRCFAVTSGQALSDVRATDAEPDLLIRDLRNTPVQSVSVGGETTPVLTLSTKNGATQITLEATSGTISPDDAIHLLSTFSGRLGDPLRCLL